MLISEEQIENQSLEWFKSLGYDYKNGYEISPDSNSPERKNFKDVILEERFLSAVRRINNDITDKMVNDLKVQITNPNIPGLFNCNREIHKWITKG